MFQLTVLSAETYIVDLSENVTEGRSLFSHEMNFMANTMRKAVEAYTYNYLNE